MKTVKDVVLRWLMWPFNALLHRVQKMVDEFNYTLDAQKQFELIAKSNQQNRMNKTAKNIASATSSFLAGINNLMKMPAFWMLIIIFYAIPVFLFSSYLVVSFVMVPAGLACLTSVVIKTRANDEGIRGRD